MSAVVLVVVFLVIVLQLSIMIVSSPEMIKITFEECSLKYFSKSRCLSFILDQHKQCFLLWMMNRLTGCVFSCNHASSEMGHPDMWPVTFI